MEIRATTAEMLQRVQAAWEDIQQYLASLSEEQLTQPTDAAGWTAKDHMMHMAVWEDGVQALLSKQNRFARMGLTESDWENGDADSINAIIQKQHQAKTLTEVRQAWAAIHQRLVETVSQLSDDELNLPYDHYDPSWEDKSPVWGRIVGNTFEHYAEHKPWIAAIVE